MEPLSIIANCDLESAETLRGTLSPDDIAMIVDYYHHTSDWNQKDIAIHLLQDCEPSRVESVMRDALHSPTVETRAIALCSLKNDSALFETFLEGGFVQPRLVDAAIQSEFGTTK